MTSTAHNIVDVCGIGHASLSGKLKNDNNDNKIDHSGDGGNVTVFVDMKVKSIECLDSISHLECLFSLAKFPRVFL